MGVSNKLKDIRISEQINQTQMAELCSVSRQTIHSIETEKYAPSVELALKIANVLNLKVEDIFTLSKEGVGMKDLNSKKDAR